MWIVQENKKQKNYIVVNSKTREHSGGFFDVRKRAEDYAALLNGDRSHKIERR